MEGSSYIYNAQKREVRVIDKNQLIDCIKDTYGARVLRQLPPSWFINLKNNASYKDIIENEYIKSIFATTVLKNVYYSPIKNQENLILAFDKTLADIEKMVGISQENNIHTATNTSGPKVYIIQWKEAPFDTNGWEVSKVFNNFQKAETYVKKAGFNLIYPNTYVYENSNKSERFKITEKSLE